MARTRDDAWVIDAAAVDDLARRSGFSGVVRLDGEGGLRFEAAYGLASRRWGVPVETGTRLGIASGTKGLTAVTVLALVARGTLGLATTARSVLGADLPLVDDAVTVEHLLAHRSGIGDYLDESAVSVDEHVMPATPRWPTCTGSGTPSATAGSSRRSWSMP